MSSSPASSGFLPPPLQAFLLDSVGSTNETAKRLVRDGSIKTAAYVLAAEQTAGKGNRGRRWLSPKGAGIYVSVVDEMPDRGTQLSPMFTLAAGVACAEVLREHFPVDVRLKPVNDLYVGNRKLGGILTESLVEGGVARTIITGVGINTLNVRRDVDAGGARPVALEELVEAAHVAKISDGGLVVTLVRRVLMWNNVCRTGDVARVRKAWESMSVPDAVFPIDGS